LHGFWFVALCPKLIVDETIAYKVQTIDNIPKCQAAYLNIRTLVDNSILTLDGEPWQKLRKMFNPAFAQAHLESLIPQMVTETMIFAGTLEKAAKQGTTVLMLEELMVLTVFVLLIPRIIHSTLLDVSVWEPALARKIGNQ
jgi:cytochrome P450